MRKKQYFFLLFIVIIVAVLFLGLDALVPHRYDKQFRNAVYHPPQIWHRDGQSFYVHDYNLKNAAKNIYEQDSQCRIRVHWGVSGYPYRFLWWTTSWHLWGSAEDEPIFLLGTDRFGRDVFSRLLIAGRLSVSLALLSVILTFFLGLAIGGCSGYWGGRLDRWLMRGCEVWMSVPLFYVMLSVRSVLPGAVSWVYMYVVMVVMFSLWGWPSVARVIRGMVLSLKERDSVVLARCAGLSRFRVLRHYVLPHTFSYALVAALLMVPHIILGEAGLSFLGLGIPDPYPSWGSMLKEAAHVRVMQQAPWILVPGLAIFGVVLAIHIAKDRLISNKS